MQDFEVPRWEAAKRAFAKAFEAGYELGKAELSSGEESQTDESEPVFYVDVARTWILDGEAFTCALLFENAGRRAALARRRGDNEAELDVMYGPDDREAAKTGNCRWVVMLHGGTPSAS